MKEDRLDLLEIYLDMMKVKKIEDVTIYQIENLLIVELFYKNNHIIRSVDSHKSKLLNTSALDSLINHYDKLLTKELQVIIFLFRDKTFLATSSDI